MKGFLHLLLKVFLLITALVFSLSCLTQYIPNTFAPWLVYLSIGFPYIFLGTLLLAIVWVFYKKRPLYYLLVVLLPAVPNLSTSIGFSLSQSPVQKPADQLRVFSWNVRGFDNCAIHADSANSVRNLMLKEIRKADADVVCLQEAAEFYHEAFLLNTPALEKLGYKYHYWPEQIVRHYPWAVMHTGVAIFSRLPIVDSIQIPFNDPSYTEHIVGADISFNGKTVTIATAHFRSFHLFQVFFDTTGLVPLHGDKLFTMRSSVPTKLQAFEVEHSIQARMVRDFIQRNPHPVIFTGDLNTVPNSYAYRQVAHNMQDAFLQKGFGLGGSIDSLPKTLRIDYLFANPRFTITNYQQRKVSLSDHYPHYMDVKWK